MLKEAKMIYELIAVERGHFYVCGDCKMAENVYQTLKSIIQEQTGMNSTQSDNFMLGLRVKNNRSVLHALFYDSIPQGTSPLHVGRGCRKWFHTVTTISVITGFVLSPRGLITGEALIIFNAATFSFHPDNRASTFGLSKQVQMFLRRFTNVICLRVTCFALL